MIREISSMCKFALQRIVSLDLFFSLQPATRVDLDKHSVLVDCDVFQRVFQPDPASPPKLCNPADFDFRLRSGSAAVDAGARLPDINDDFTGRTPDLGAYEAGFPVPHYGPRP